MKNVQTYSGKKVFVLGLAKSGYHAALLLQKLGAKVTVSDQKKRCVIIQLHKP